MTSSLFRPFGFVLFLLCVAEPTASGQTVAHYSGNGGLQGGFTEARESALQSRRSVWFGFSVDRMSSDNSYFGREDDEPSLSDVVFGRTAVPVDEDVRTAARNEIDRLEGNRSQQKVHRPVALLLSVGSQGDLQKVKISDMDRPVELDGDPLFWGGTTSQDEAAEFAGRIRQSSEVAAVREDAVTFVGLLDESERAKAVLADALSEDRSDDVRKQAVFWIGKRGTADALSVVLKTVRSDQSEDVRAHAVFVLSRFDRDDTIDLLLDVARSAKSDQVAGAASFWAGRLLSKKLFGDEGSDDEMDRVRKQALYALVGDSDESVGVLVDLARNGSSSGVRRQAVFMLGQSHSAEALDALKSLAARGR